MTAGCPGFTAISRGSAARGHAEACRNRMKEGMTRAGDANIDSYNQRIAEASQGMLPGKGQEMQVHEKQRKTGTETDEGMR